MDLKNECVDRTMGWWGHEVWDNQRERWLAGNAGGLLGREPVGCGGWVWLDSAVGGSRRMMLGRDAEEVLVGSDWQRLELAVEERRRQAGWERGAAVGWVNYDLSFCFGIFRELEIFVDGGLLAGVGLPRKAGVWRGRFRATVDRERYCWMVERAMDYIRAGDIYQVCLAHHFEVEGIGCPLAYYLALRKCSPAPFGAYLDLGGVQVASASPELFLRMVGRRIMTRPIKGTRPRMRDGEMDARMLEELKNSAKERAELVMITDLERNDLGQVCEFGSVEVTGLLEAESFAQVHHLVSTVEGRLRGDVSHCGALRACMPGGSVTGAPKRRAMEIIAELEGRPRRGYTGAVGYFGFDGTSVFSMAIRTAVFEGQMGSFGTGAGIVADSVPELEWKETLHKASGLLAAAEIGD